MKVGATLHRDYVSLSILPPEYKNALVKLLDTAKSKYGGYVTLELSLPHKIGSEEQNRAWHSLIREYWLSGCSSYQSYEDMRDSLKLKVGGAKEYIYLTDKQHTVKSLSEIPQGARYIEIPKSWTDFTKDERSEMIDFTIKEMIEAGVNSRKFDEILSGMEK
ncbi:MAG: hypothetical protein ACOYJC_11680 [Christensenellales bacterium]|jgi:hypothetical protein